MTGAATGPAFRLHPARDLRRWLQLGLAALWLFDALLQFQPFMFSAGFARMLAGAAHGNPAVIAGPVTWAAHLTGQHPVAANAVFGSVQLLLALGVAWRPTVRLALAGSAVWALAVWWLGEGLGGLFTPAASPVTGAPGAAVLYALLAVLVWPSGRPRTATFAAGTPLGPAAARAIWVLLWFGLAWFSVADAPAATIATLRSGPGPLILAAMCCLIAAGILLPVPGVRGTAAAAAAIALAMWAAGQDFGGIATGMGTDPGTGPLLALLAVSYWPSRALTRGAAPAGTPVPTGAGVARARAPGPGRMPFPRRVSRAGALVRAGGAVLVAQVIMGAATAGMLVPRFDPVPPVAWQILAAAGTAWFSWLCLRTAVTSHPGRGHRAGHDLPHALACGAMLYMLLNASGMRPAPAVSALLTGATGPMHAGAHLPAVAIALAVAMAGAAVLTTDRLTSLVPARAALPVQSAERAAPPGPAVLPTAVRGYPLGRAAPPARGRALLVPRLAACCQVAMGIAMAYLLIQML
jgi:hypothetical protein